MCTINQLNQLKLQIFAHYKSLTKDLLQQGVSQIREVTLRGAPIKGSILLCSSLLYKRAQLFIEEDN